jgi:hypothetical protein
MDNGRQLSPEKQRSLFVSLAFHRPISKREMIMVNEAKLNQLIGQMLSDLGGASGVAMVRIGDALGLYRALYVKGAMTAEELAAAICASGSPIRPLRTISPTIR